MKLGFMKISTESKMDFDYSVATEDRFALRKWLEELVDAVNYNDRGVYTERLADNLTVEGFSELPMDRDAYLAYLGGPSGQKATRVIRFPILEIKFKRYLYHLAGTYEEFVDGILSYEGTLEMAIVKQDDMFQLASIKFYPRLRVSPNENPQL
jgi:hypothetical protein